MSGAFGIAEHLHLGQRLETYGSDIVAGEVDLDDEVTSQGLA